MMTKKTVFLRWSMMLFLFFGILILIQAQVSSFPVKPHSQRFSSQTYVYKIINNVRIHADVYRTENNELQPVLVWIHGGALIVGNRKDVPKDLRRFCKTEGCILVSLDYRLAPEVKLSEIVKDIEDGIGWIRNEGKQLFQADSSKIVVAGESAGGYLALMMGVLVVPAPNALVSYWGYGDILGPWYLKPSKYYENHVARIPKERAYGAVGKNIVTNMVWNSPLRKERTNYYVYLRQNGLWTKEVTGYDPVAQRRIIKNYCPVFGVSPQFPPTFLIHGVEDTDVPYEQSVAMSMMLSDHKVPNELVVVDRAGHRLNGGDKAEIAHARARAIEFIKNYLK